ncbi:MAG: class B sortase [Oscillospiraceae bacterium]|nr:class B sortase [Oscillospiraceae bacterium]
MKRKITLIQILFLCVFIGCGIYFAKYYIDKHKTEKEMEQLRDMIQDTGEETEQIETYEPNGMLTRYYPLYERSNDMSGWIKIDGTCIDYPVMYRAESNAYYLHRNFDGEDNSAGMPFLDYQCDPRGSSQNMIIYAHNMRNGTMFHELLNYRDHDFAASYPYINFDTLYERRQYQIFAVFNTRVGAPDEFKYYEFINAENNEEFNAFVDECIAHSLYSTDMRPEYGDELITLSTCSYNANDERFVVVGKLIARM